MLDFLFLLFGKICLAQACNDKAFYALMESTVQLTIEKNDSMYLCTGIIIEKDSSSVGILTAQHCTKDADEITIDGTHTALKLG